MANFRHIRPCLTIEAAKLFMHSMIFSHFTYCFTSWSQASTTVLKSIESLYKQSLKIFDQRTNIYHYCNIVQKHHLLIFDNNTHLVDACLIFKILNGYAPPPLCQFITQKDNNGRVTRATTRGDCAVQFKCTTFGRSIFSIRAINYWNTLPTELSSSTNDSTFKYKLKKLFKASHICNRVFFLIFFTGYCHCYP